MPLNTPRNLAKALGVHIRTVQGIITRLGLEPVERVDRTRVFSEEQAAQIAAEAAKPRGRKPSAVLTEVMNEHIKLPGFPALIVTRAFAYTYLKGLGSTSREADYFVFKADK